MLLVSLASSGCVPLGAGIDDAPPIMRPIHEPTPPIYFAGLKFDIERGVRVGRYRFALGSCRPFAEGLYWGSGDLHPEKLLRSWGESVEETLAATGFNVYRARSEIFAGYNFVSENPLYHLAGEITAAEFDVCDRYDWLTGSRLDLQRGRARIEVVWSLYSVVEHRVVLRRWLQAEGELAVAQRDGVGAILERALEAAVERLAVDTELLALLRADPVLPAALPRKRPSLVIPLVQPANAPIVERIDTIRDAVVVIDHGNGHGSGFFLSSSVLLTNAHVAGASGRVAVEMNDGRRLLGEVLRADVPLDVALVRVPGANAAGLPVRTHPVRVTEEVYAIGAPLSPSLRQTVSRGVISGLRERPGGFRELQADVDVHGGSSGGPLLDAGGNVVGLTRAGIPGSDAQTSVGLNYFIPVTEALERLGVRISSGAMPQARALSR